MVTHFRKFHPRAPLPAAVVAAAALAATGSAATITVPTQQPTIAAALAAAADGDEIRVRHDHTEVSSANTVSAKSLAIRSFDAAYAMPQAGARWVLASGGGGTAGGLVLLQSGARLSVEGFSEIKVPGGNAFLVGASSTLTVSNCTFTGIVLSNTAAIKADAAANVTVTVNRCVFEANGRGLWFNNVTGTSSLNLDETTFASNSSYPIEFRTMAGTHHLDLSRCSIAQATNSPTRLYFFGTGSGATTSNTVRMNRCVFTPSGAGATPVIVGGVSDAASASSGADIVLTNCLIDLRSAAASASGVGSLSDQPNRKSRVTVRHSTIVTAAAGQSGLQHYSSANPGAWSIENSIVDGPGTALKNDGPGTLTSGRNLFNTAAGVTAGTGTAGIMLSGSEILGQSPRFVDGPGGNFHLAALSPAVDAGADLGIETDLDGAPRPQGAAPDLGAYEQTPPVASAGSWSEYE